MEAYRIERFGRIEGRGEPSARRGGIVPRFRAEIRACTPLAFAYSATNRWPMNLRHFVTTWAKLAISGVSDPSVLYLDESCEGSSAKRH